MYFVHLNNFQISSCTADQCTRAFVSTVGLDKLIEWRLCDVLALYHEYTSKQEGKKRTQ